MGLDQLYAIFEELDVIGRPGWREASSDGLFAYVIRRRAGWGTLNTRHPREMTDEQRDELVEFIRTKYGPADC